MSTRSLIGRIKGDGFEGVYHHSDGYPTWLGKRLWDRAHQVPLGILLDSLIDQHHGGWSYIGNGKDKEGACYCHTRGEIDTRGNPLLTDQDDAGMEWAYVFNPTTNHLLIFERQYISSGHHMVGMFGFGAEGNQKWVLKADVPIDGPEPNWSAMER